VQSPVTYSIPADTFDPKVNRCYKAGDPQGYQVANWQLEDAYNYMFKPQMRDSASPQNNYTATEQALEMGVTVPRNIQLL